MSADIIQFIPRPTSHRQATDFPTIPFRSALPNEPAGDAPAKHDPGIDQVDTAPCEYASPIGSKNNAESRHRNPFAGAQPHANGDQRPDRGHAIEGRGSFGPPRRGQCDPRPRLGQGSAIARDSRQGQDRAHLQNSSALLSILKIPTAKAFEPLLRPARYKGVHGGRGREIAFLRRASHRNLPGRARHARGLHPRGAAHPGAVLQAADREQDRSPRPAPSLQGLQRQDRNTRRRPDHLSRHARSYRGVDQVPGGFQNCMDRRGAKPKRAQPVAVAADHPRGSFRAVGQLESVQYPPRRGTTLLWLDRPEQLLCVSLMDSPSVEQLMLLSFRCSGRVMESAMAQPRSICRISRARFSRKGRYGGKCAGRLTSSWFGTSAAALGATGGSEKNALSSPNQLPQVTPSVASYNLTLPLQGFARADPSSPDHVSEGANNAIAVTLPIGGSIAMNPFGSATPSSFATCQPTIICNYIVRVI